MKLLLACLTLVLGSCVSVRHQMLDTSWRGEAHPGVMSTLTFSLDGTARWTFELPGGVKAYDLRYDLNTEPKPAHLDFSGFKDGPFAGHTLFGIAEWNDDTLRYDARPADPGQTSQGIRPTEFTAETRTFKRVR